MVPCINQFKIHENEKITIITKESPDGEKKKEGRIRVEESYWCVTCVSVKHGFEESYFSWGLTHQSRFSSL